METLDRDELATSFERGEVLVLDVRPRHEYAAGHKHTEVVAYCRGPYCVYADDAVRELTRRGFRARRLIDGFPEWKRAGWPVASVEEG